MNDSITSAYITVNTSRVTYSYKWNFFNETVLLFHELDDSLAKKGVPHHFSFLLSLTILFVMKLCLHTKQKPKHNTNNKFF